MYRKRVYFIAFVILSIGFSSCNRVQESSQGNESNTTTKLQTLEVSDTIDAIFEPELEANNESEEEKDIVEKSENVGIDDGSYPSNTIEEIDYSDCFDNIEGCAVFLNSQTHEYKIYNIERSNQFSSPCSTFKIISTLMGLETGVISSADSKMGYDGTMYSTASWNKDMGLKEAFRESCIWYFRKVINHIGPKEVQSYLDQLKYGNRDIREWYGSKVNNSPALNGFWLESSLQISPKEQVDVLANIFEESSEFAPQNIKLLKEVMLVESNNDTYVYGKTGSGRNPETGKNDNGWFVGMYERTDEVYYFAVHLTDNQKEVSGQKAKEIALNILEKYYE